MVTTVAQVGVAVGGLLLYRLLALEKGADGLASYALIKQVVVFLIPAAMIGLQTAVPRYVALGRATPGAVEAHLVAASVLILAAGGVVSVALLVSPDTTAATLLGDDSRSGLVVPLVLTLAATVVFEVVAGYYRGRSEFVLASIARIVSVAAFPVALLLLLPEEPLTDLINWMALGLLLTSGVLVAAPLARAVRRARSSEAVASSRVLLDYGRRRIPGEYASVALITVPPVLAAHVAPLDEVAYLTAALYVLAVLTTAFQPVGLVFLPLLSRLCAEDFEAARRWVGQLTVCTLHIAMFLTPQLLLFADVAVREWLGPEFDQAGPIVRIVMVPVAAWLFYLALRSALDAAAVKAYNSRNNLVALAVTAAATGVVLALDVGDPVEGIAVSFALGIFTLGALTLATVHSLFRIDAADYALRAALILTLATAGAAVALRLTVVEDHSSLLMVAAIIGFEACLAGLFLAGLIRAGVSWPRDIRARFSRSLA